MTGFSYKSYVFIDKDPIIDEVRTVFNESGKTKQWVTEESGVTAKTLRDWFEGGTKRPQAATINAVLRSLGYKLGVVPHTRTVVPVTIVKAPAAAEPPPASARHVVQMNKYRGKK